MEPRVPCELVRGYLDFSPHAWNVVIVKEGESFVRKIVDSCHPLDIREDSDPEYFCRLAFASVLFNAISGWWFYLAFALDVELEDKCNHL